MPKETFLNLSDDKRERIINIALEEFAEYDYRTASLSRVVEKAGIAKGSMYQYFENKKDLYLYLVDFVSKKKLEYISKHLNGEFKDFFDMYKKIIFAGAKFGLDYPLYNQIGYNAFKEGSNEEIGSMSTKLLKMSQEYLKGYIAQAQQQGQIRKDIELDMISFIISRLSVDIGDFIADKYNFTYKEIITAKDKLPITDEQLEAVMDDLIKFFRHGLEG